MPTDRKKRKGVPWKKPGKPWQSPFPTGSRGVFVTCDGGMEKAAGQEALDIFNRFYETLVPAPQGEGMDAARTEDFSSALAAELKSLKSGEKQQFQVWNTGIPGSVYIKFDSDYDGPGPVALVKAICKNALDTGASGMRRCVRLFPVERCCAADIKKIKTMAAEMVADVFKTGADVCPIQFAVDVDRRCNSDNVQRLEVINAFVDHIATPPHLVNLSAPDYTIVVQVVRNACGASIVEGYHELCKCNVRQCSAKGRGEDPGKEASGAVVGTKRKAQDGDGREGTEKRRSSGGKEGTRQPSMTLDGDQCTAGEGAEKEGVEECKYGAGRDVQGQGVEEGEECGAGLGGSSTVSA